MEFKVMQEPRRTPTTRRLTRRVARLKLQDVFLIVSGSDPMACYKLDACHLLSRRNWDLQINELHAPIHDSPSLRGWPLKLCPFGCTAWNCTLAWRFIMRA